MKMKQFKAESKRLLDLMINSIYTHKEIFLRELISNASDAIDKLYYHVADRRTSRALNRDDFAIQHRPRTRRTAPSPLTDNGCGMTKEELENNLGTIAKSGSLAFKQENEAKGGYRHHRPVRRGLLFRLHGRPTACKVISRAYGADEAYAWESHGAEGYTVEPCEKEDHGTDIILTIKEDTEDENYERIPGVPTACRSW